MRKTLLYFVFLLASLHSHAQVWIPVGSQGFSAGEASHPSIAIDRSGTAYVAFVDATATHSGASTVMKYNGSIWVVVGNTGFSDTGVVYTSMAIDMAGTPYVVYMEIPAGVGGNGPCTVKKYNGSSWVTVGAPEFTTSQAIMPAIAIDGSGTPYVAFVDDNSGDKATVMKYNGSSWVNVGTPDFSMGSVQGYHWIAIDSMGTPYVAFGDQHSSGKITVMKYNGSSWVNVGSPGFSVGSVQGGSIAIDTSNTVYVVYSDNSSSQKATVMKYNGSSWVAVGGASVSAGQADYTSVVIDRSGTPFISYMDYSNGEKATVMKYNGSNWINAGNAGFSDSLAGDISMAVDSSGTPYVAYTDWGDSYKATVMKYTDTSTGTPNIINNASSTITIAPNPNHGTFTLNIFSQQKENANIVITNVLGQKVKELTSRTNIDTQIQLNNRPGMYFITAVTAEGKQNCKVVVY